MQETDVEQLLTDLKSDDFRVSFDAQSKLGSLPAAFYTPELIEKLLDIGDSLGYSGKHTIGRILTKIKAIALPVLRQQLATANKVRLEIIVEVVLASSNLEESFIAELIWKILQDVDSPATSMLSFKFAASKYKQVAIDYLLSLLTHPDLEIASKANQFLATGLKPVEREELFAPFLQDANLQVRRLVISNFISYTDHSEQSFVKEALLKTLEDADPEVYRKAILASAIHKLLTQPVFEQLVQLLQESTTQDDLVSNVVVAIRLALEFSTPATTNVLIELFARPASSDGLREQIALTLGRIKGVAALPMLKETFTRAESSLKTAIAGAILSLEPDSKSAQDFLLQTAQTSWQIRTVTMAVLDNIGLAAKPIARQLAKLVLTKPQLPTANNESNLYGDYWAIQILSRIELELLVEPICNTSEKYLTDQIAGHLSNNKLEQLLDLLETRASNGNNSALAGIELIRKTQLERKEQNIIMQDPKF